MPTIYLPNCLTTYRLAKDEASWAKEQLNILVSSMQPNGNALRENITSSTGIQPNGNALRENITSSTGIQPNDNALRGRGGGALTL